MGLSEIKGYMIGLVLFVVIITGGVFMLGTFRLANPSIDSSRIDSFNSTFNKAENITNAVNGIGDSLEATGDNPGPLGWFNVLFGSAWNGLKAVFGSLSFINGIIVGVGDLFAIPPAIVVLIPLIVIIIIVFAIWGAIIQAQD